MPTLVLYSIFETSAGLEIRPNPQLGEPVEKIRIFKQYMGQLNKETDGSIIGEYINGSDDTPFNLNGTVDFPDPFPSGPLVAHDKAVDYYDLAGNKTTIVADNDLLDTTFAAYYGFTNPSVDF
jgi:hypothetical protein